MRFLSKLYGNQKRSRFETTRVHVPGPKNVNSMCGTIPYFKRLFGLMNLNLLHTNYDTVVSSCQWFLFFVVRKGIMRLVNVSFIIRSLLSENSSNLRFSTVKVTLVCDPGVDDG